MRRTIEQAFDALEGQIKAWAAGEAKPDLRVFVYPPEWEALVLRRLPHLAEKYRAQGRGIELEDVGNGFHLELQKRRTVVERLEQMGRDQVLSDLEHIASTYLRRALREPPGEGVVCRIVMNTGSLATFVSYSAISNELVGNGSETGVPATIIAFPGEADDRSLNMLGLRVDTNYRVPRV